MVVIDNQVAVSSAYCAPFAVNDDHFVKLPRGESILLVACAAAKSFLAYGIGQ
jgi:hypothetical protein